MLTTLATSVLQHARRCWKQFVVVLMIAVLIAPPSFLFGSAGAKSERENDVRIAFERLRKHLDGASKKLGDAKAAARLGKELDSAEDDFKAAAFCEAIARLAAAAAEAQQFQREKYNPAAEELFNRLSSLRRDVAAVSNGKCKEAARLDQPAVIEVDDSDAKGLRGRARFGEAIFSSLTEDGELYTQIEIPGLPANIGKPGVPGVPVLHRLIAVPQGAEAVVNIKFDDSRALRLRLNLYPIQPEPLDRASAASDDKNDSKSGDKDELRFPKERFIDPPFTKDKDIYAGKDPFPAHIATLQRAGRARDINLVQLSIAAGQYTPDSKELTLFEEIEFEVAFTGGKEYFIDRIAESEFDTVRSLYGNVVLNIKTVWDNVNPKLPRRLNCGEEYLILTHPDFLEAAEALAEWKNRKGIITSVVEVNDGSGSGPDTRSEIDEFIENRFNRCGLRPSYILLLGDAEFIPPFYRSTSGSATTGTDYPYALVGEDVDDLAPDFALGRIPVDTLDQARTVVDKIIRYESAPPFNASFYQNASIASQFQCCRIGGDEGRDQRSFIETSELVRNEMLVQGYQVERIYTQSVETGYFGDTTPRRFFNGTLLPEELRAANGFAWDGDSDDIINAFNGGRFLILHRDHGWKNGWGHPEFTKEQVTNDLSNGALLPVVFSVNCASGLFDNETANGDYDTDVDEVYFAERLLRHANGGTVGMLGDTRDSPTWANSALTRGYFDAVWPNTVADFGASRSIRRLGDILNHGKLYLMTQVGVAGTTVAPSEDNLRSEMYMWHVIGDPTLEMWTSRPDISLAGILETALGARSLKIKYALEGVLLTVLQRVKGSIIAIGRAEVKDGQAEIVFERRPLAGVPIQISASHSNAVSVLLTDEDLK